MKVTSEQSFAPVTIVLETQEEVDELHAWANHGIVSPSVNPRPLSRLHALLREYVSSGALDRYNELDKRIRTASCA